MARLSPVTVAALATAAVAAAGVAAYGFSRSGPRAPRRPNPAPQGRGHQPAEGYGARWAARRRGALRRCLRAPDVQSFAQALTCALNNAFPEAAPWTDPASWTAWMQDAAALVQGDLLAAASRDGYGARGWEISVWLQGPAAVGRCRTVIPAAGRAEIALCAASTLYPQYDWLRALAPWQHRMLEALMEAS